MKKFNLKEMAIKAVSATAAVVAMGVPALADGANTRFDLPPVFTSFLNIIIVAVQILGAFAMVFGAVQMGFAFKNDDADGKSKGMRATIAGAIVFMVGIMANVIIKPYIASTPLNP